MFIKIHTKEYKGEKYYYASLVENKRINGKVRPRAEFKLAGGEELVAAYEYCNLHGLWKK